MIANHLGIERVGVGAAGSWAPTPMPNRKPSHAPEAEPLRPGRAADIAALGIKNKRAVALEKASFYLDLAREPSLLFGLLEYLRLDGIAQRDFEDFVSVAFDVPNFETNWLPLKPTLRTRDAKRRKGDTPSSRQYAAAKHRLDLAWQCHEAREAWFVGWLLRLPSELEVIEYIASISASRSVENPWAHRDDDILLMYEYLARRFTAKMTKEQRDAFLRAVGAVVVNAYESPNGVSSAKSPGETDRLDAAVGAALCISGRTVREARRNAQERASRPPPSSIARYRYLRRSLADALKVVAPDVRRIAPTMPHFLGRTRRELSPAQRRLLVLFRRSAE